MPAQRQAVQMGEQGYFDFTRCVLLDADPKERSEIVEEAHSAGSAALQKLEKHVQKHPVPAERGSSQTVNWKTRRFSDYRA